MMLGESVKSVLLHEANNSFTRLREHHKLKEGEVIDLNNLMSEKLGIKFEASNTKNE